MQDLQGFTIPQVDDLDNLRPGGKKEAKTDPIENVVDSQSEEAGGDPDAVKMLTALFEAGVSPVAILAMLKGGKRVTLSDEQKKVIEGVTLADEDADEEKPRTMQSMIDRLQHLIDTPAMDLMKAGELNDVKIPEGYFDRLTQGALTVSDEGLKEGIAIGLQMAQNKLRSGLADEHPGWKDPGLRSKVHPSVKEAQREKLLAKELLSDQNLKEVLTGG
jgi:hypothetical protein